MKQATLKPFNLEQAIAGKPIVCRDGTPAKFLYYSEELGTYKFGALVLEEAIGFTTSGRCSIISEPGYDLFMGSEKKSGWINLYRPRIYSSNVVNCSSVIYTTKEQAIYDAKQGVQATVEIHWEE